MRIYMTRRLTASPDPMDMIDLTKAKQKKVYARKMSVALMTEV